MTAINPG